MLAGIHLGTPQGGISLFPEDYAMKNQPISFSLMAIISSGMVKIYYTVIVLSVIG